MDMRSRPPDAWSSGDRYEPYVGRWSRLVAGEFLAWLAVPAGRRWVDVGCGTGALTHTILARCAPAGVVGVEPSDAFRAHAAGRVRDPHATFLAGDAQALPVEDGAADTVVSGLVLNFVPDPAAAMREMCRAVRAGGGVAAYVWDYAGGMQMMRHFWDAAVARDPGARALDEGVRFPLCRPESLRALFEGAGLAGVAIEPIDVPTVFAGFDDFWSPFLGGTGPAPAYLASLPAGDRARLRDEVRDRLPVAGDGAIRLTARAWAARGRTPARPR